MPRSRSTPTRSYGGRSAEERRAERRTRLLAAGLEVFGTEGYRAGTVRRICAEAGVTDRYFYEAFGSTEDLLAAVFTDAAERARAAVVEAVLTLGPGPAPEDVVHAAVEAYFRFVEDRRVVRVCWMEITGVAPEIDALYRAEVDGFARLVVSMAEIGAPEWMPASREEAYLVAVGLVGGVSQLCLAWFLADGAIPLDSAATAASRLFLGQGALGRN